MRPKYSPALEIAMAAEKIMDENAWPDGCYPSELHEKNCTRSRCAYDNYTCPVVNGEYNELDDEYENEPKRGKVSKPSKPQGSLTNHLRSVRSDRDGAHKRSKRLNKEK